MKKLAALIILLVAHGLAEAQQQSMSAPSHSPIPMRVTSQQPADSREKVGQAESEKSPAPPTVQIKAITGRHISTNNPALDQMVKEAAAQYGIDPCLIVSVMKAESSFHLGAVSPKGASGLMQLMPATAIRFGVRNIFDARENVFGGARYLRWLLDRFNGDVRLALAGYNAGEGAVEFYGYRIPPFLETQNYVRMIYARYSGIHLTSPPEAPVTVQPAPSEVAEEKTPTYNYNQVVKGSSSSLPDADVKVKQ